MATNTDGREEIKPVAPTEQTKWRDPSLVGKYMVDPKTGLAGLFRSPDNGETWVLTDTVYGHVYNQDEVDNIWDNGAGHKVADEIKSATADLPNVRKQADEAVKFAESAVAASKVNSDAIVAQSEAISEAKSAMDSATAEIQQLKANAASDVAQIRADVAQVQNEVDTAKAANSASVDKLKSDIGLVKKDLNNVRDSLTKAQSAVEQNQKLINDSVAKINSDIAQSRQDIITAQQANDDLAKQLDTYSKEAQEQGKTIKTIQDNQDGFSITIADVKGDVTKVSDTVDGLSAGLKDAQGNIASVKAQADQLNATLTDHSKDIAQLTATAKELSSTLEDADGRLSKVEQTASEQSTTLSDLQGNLTQVKQTADNLVTTLKDAQGNIDQIKQDAKGTLEQLSNAQGDITALQKDVSGIKLTIADHDKNIHTLQADSKTLKDDMADAKGNISSLQKTSTSLVSEFKDHDGRLSKVEQTANTLTNEFSDQQGHLNRVEQTANGTQQTVANQQGQINSIQTDVSGVHQTITGQGNQIANINVTLSGLNTKYEGVSGDLNNLKSQAQWATVTSAVDLNNVKTPCHEFLKGTVTNAPNESAWWYLTVEGSESGRITQTVIADWSNNRYTRRWADSWSAWVKDATQTDVTALSNRITTNSTQITQNQQAIALKADQSTVDNLSGKVSQNKAQLKVQADQISSKVSSTDFKTLDDKVNGMKIGGRNLVAGTGQDTVIDDTANTGTRGWCFWLFNLAQQPKVGDQITVSSESTLTGKGNLGTYEVQLFNSTTTANRSNSRRLTAGKRSSATLEVTNLNGTGDTVLLIYAGNIGDTEGKKNVIHHLKVEFGNVATDWTPAPEDLTTAIQKNSTAIDQTNKQISLKADQTEVNNLNNTAQQLSARLNVMAGQVQSKVDETKVNNLIDGRGFATQSTVQSLIDQRAGTLSESITGLETKFSNSSSINLAEKTNQGVTNWQCDPGNGATNLTEININGARGVRFNNTKKSTSWWVAKYPLNLDFFEPNTDYIVTFDIRTSTTVNSQPFLQIAQGDSSHRYFADADTGKSNFPANQLVHVSIVKHTNDTLDRNAETFYLNSSDLGNCDWVDIVNLKIARGTIDKGYSPAPSDNATVTQLQSVTASIDGLQSTVANKADKSQITQLSNVIQSKVSASDFNDLKDKTTWKNTDNIDLNSAVSQQNLFVMGGSNLPPGNYWWYVQVESGYDSRRIVQYAVSDRDNIHYSRQYDGSKWSAWSQGATESEITQLRDDINLRVKSGDLLSQINLTAGNTLIQSNKLYLDASSVVFSGRAFIPSAAIASLSADKINTGWLNTNNVSLGDGRTRIRADHDYLYIQPTGSASSNTGIRMSYTGLDFLTNVIPNGYNSSVPYYSIGYDGASNGYLRISAFDHLNPGGATATQNWFTMVDAISLTNSEINFAAEGNMRMQVVDGGVNIKPTLFFQNNTNNGTWAGFTRADNSNIVEFSSGDNNGENFRIDCGARFMQYVYINGNARAQQWLTNSTLSKKTNIRKLDQQIALDKIRQDDQYLYEYKRNIEQGIYDPQASFIIDDVNDVSHYSVPREFIDQSGNYREPNVELAYLIAAFQAIDKQVQKQKEEIKELKEKLQHE